MVSEQDREVGSTMHADRSDVKRQELSKIPSAFFFK